MNRKILPFILGCFLIVGESVAIAQTNPTGNPQTANRPELRLGSQGAEVSQVQALLRLLGYYQGEINGFYNQETYNAVSRFQQAAGLPVNGVFGQESWNRLLPPIAGSNTAVPAASTTSPVASVPSATNPPAAAPARNTNPPASAPSRNTTTTAPARNTNPPAAAATNTNSPSLPVLREGMSGQAVMFLQERLRRLGLLQGQADGAFGPQTLEAVRAAQRRFNLEVDGVVGPATWRALMR